MTRSNSIFLCLLLLVEGIATHAQNYTVKQLEEMRSKVEQEEWAKKTVPPLNWAQLAADWEAKRQADPARFEKIFEDARRAVREDLLPNVFRMAMADKTLAFGALNLYLMFSRFQAVKVYPDYQKRTPTQADPHRDTDAYSADYQMAILNQGFLFAEPQRRLNILLHVLLGASGYQDENYQLTVALVTAERIIAKKGKNSSLAGVEIHSLFPQTEEELYRKATLVAGGFTGTNGGGDSSSAWVKTELLNLAVAVKQLSAQQNWSCRHAWSNTTTYLRDIQQLKIESNKDLLSIHGFRRVGLNSYQIERLPTMMGGTDILKGHSRAATIVVGVLLDLCESKYPARTRP